MEVLIDEDTTQKIIRILRGNKSTYLQNSIDEPTVETLIYRVSNDKKTLNEKQPLFH